MRQIRSLVAQLDIHAPNETYRIHVVHLKYAPASEMVDTLNGLLGGGGGPSTLSPTTGRNSLGRGSALGNLNGSAFGSGFGSSSSFGSSVSGGLGGALGGSSSFSGIGSSGGGIGGAGGGGFGTSGGLGGSRSSQGGPVASAGTSGGRGTDFEEPVSVTADLATNSLIVSAAPQDYETLRRVIDQLDIPRTQVFVQAIIVEVSVEHTKDIGVNWLANGTIGGNVLGVGVLNTGNLQTALGNPLGLTGLGVGLASGDNCSIPSTSSTTTTTTGTSTGTIVVPCDIALMTALQSDTHANILSAPTLLTADNEEAMIVVGQNLPFVGSAAANSALSGQIFNSVDRQNVGISLDMVPQVSEGDSIRLDIYEEVSNVVNGTNNQATNPLGPTTTIRSASTTVFVQNHRTAVIGGLISNETDTARTGVPFLSDIPVIGNLFTDNSKDTTKDNLLIFLTPHVIRSRDDLAALAIDERQRFVKELGKKEVNVMPPSQFQRLYKPTFNAPISPQEDLEQSAPIAPNGMSLPNSAMPSSGGSSSAYPPLTYAAPGGSASYYPSTSYAPSAYAPASAPAGAATYPGGAGAAPSLSYPAAPYSPPPVYRGAVGGAGPGSSSRTSGAGAP
jgi:general secretion pathway protein D